jgi:tRNA A37 threonylcarbamoyladenosine modification protein TsaB
MGLVPLLQQLTKRAGVDLRAVDVIVAPRGPSPFTIQRVLITVAKSLHFCAPNADVFAPSNFHVLAHAAKERVSDDLIVLVNSYNQGFFGASFQKRAGFLYMLPGASFYDKNAGVHYLKSNANALFVTDFSEEQLEHTLSHYVSSDHLIRLSPINFALTQIDLFASQVTCDDFDYHTLEPYRLHTPTYAKIATTHLA